MTGRTDRRASSRVRIPGALCLAGLAVAVVAAQQAPDRSKPPVPGPLPALTLPVVETRQVPNGPEVWVVGMHKVPTVHLQWINKRGGGNSDAVPGLASLTADMLDEGAGNRTALELADGIDNLGAQLSSSSAWDAAYVDLHVPVARLAQALPMMADAIVRPTFPDAELDRLTKERLAALISAQDDPEELVAFAFTRLLYGPKHPYGTSMIGTAASLQSITAAAVRDFHRRRYSLDGSKLIVVGDVTADGVMPLIAGVFGSAGAGSAAAPWQDAPQLTSRRVYLIDKPGAAQSQIRIGWVGPARATPDYFAIRVMNTILGGAFTSRLNHNLREEHGYAYGASSRFEMRTGRGPFYAAAGVQTDKTAEALTEFFKELARIHETVDADELEKARSYVALQLARNFETTRDAAAALAQLEVYGLPANYYATYADRVRAVTAADVKRAADQYIQPDKFQVVIVGDRKLIEPRIKALNLGPITVVDAVEIMK